MNVYDVPKVDIPEIHATSYSPPPNPDIVPLTTSNPSSHPNRGNMGGSIFVKDTSLDKKPLRINRRHKLASNKYAAETIQQDATQNVSNTVTTDPLMSKHHTKASDSKEKPSEFDTVNDINGIYNISYLTCR